MRNPRPGDVLIVCEDPSHSPKPIVTVHADGTITAQGRQGRLCELSVFDLDDVAIAGGAIDHTDRREEGRPKITIACRVCKKPGHKWRHDKLLAAVSSWRDTGFTSVSLSALAASIELLAQHKPE